MSGGGHRLGGSGRKQNSPGALKQATIQAFAHGADMMMHFQFRTFPYGAEQLNYAIVDMDGVPRRRYYEMQETAEILKKLEALETARFCGEVAVVFDYDSLWAMKIKPANSGELNYWEYCRKYYDVAQSLGVNADVISLSQDFNQYKVLILPTAFVLNVASAEKLKRYVEKGGTLIATFLTAVKNYDNVGYTQTLPANLTDLFGVEVEEVEPVFSENQTKLRLFSGSLELLTSDHIWSELLGGSAQMWGRYCEDYKEGAGVVSCNRYGDGTAYYLGTDLEDSVLKAFLEDIMTAAAVSRSSWKCSDQVEVITRTHKEHRYTFLFNFANKDVTVEIPVPAVNYLTGEPCGRMEVMKRQGFLVFEEAIEWVKEKQPIIEI